MKKVYSLLVALALILALGAPAFAEEEASVLAPGWALDELVEAESLGLYSGTYSTVMTGPISDDALVALTDAVAAKLALLELEPADEQPEAHLLDGTRGSVARALYAEAAQYKVPHAGDDGTFFLAELSILRGDGTGELHLDRPCTVQEAVIMAQRLVLALYDWADAGTRGLLWRATHGGNTLYLFGTVHLDRNNLYPLHKTVREALMGADAAIFEIDLGDQTGLDELALMQMYTDGTTLKDHVSAEVYEKTMRTMIPEGLDEESYAVMEAQIAAFKPWALALGIESMLMTDETTGSVLATDSYLTSKAYAGGIPVSGVETYALQIAVFDTLSEEYQAEMLGEALILLTGELEEELGTVGDAVDAYFLPWQRGDLAGFEAAFGKADVLASEDELTARLFTERDPGMIAAAAEMLEADGENVYFLALGAGHMVDPGGVVGGLRALGYTVELVK